MKKILLLFFVLLLVVVPTAFAAETVASGTCGADLTWTMDDKGTLTISGTGAMDYYGIMNAPWGDFDDDVRYIVIKEGVTALPQYAFDGCYNTHEIYIPASLTDIHPQAPDPLNLRAYVVAEGNPVYRDVNGILFSKDMTELLGFPGGKSYKGSYTVPNTVTKIGDYAFKHCDLGEIILPDSVKTIGNYAFHWSGHLKRVRISEGVTAIGEGAFDLCYEMTEARIPASVTSIGEGAFVDCYALDHIEVDDGNQFYCDMNGVLMDKDMTTLYQVPGAYTGDLVLPAGVTRIVCEAAKECDNLTCVVIPGGVELIESFAFVYCENLTEIWFMGSAPADNYGSVFSYVTATAHYPAGDESWTEKVMNGFRGDLTWVSYEPHEHDYTVTLMSVPNCTEKGSIDYLCGICGLHYVLKQPALGHTEEAARGIAPTYSASGITEGKFCVTCGVATVPQQTIPRLELPFVDVPRYSYYYDSVCWALDGEITTGKTATEFMPKLDCTRAEIVTFLWRSEGCPAPESTGNPFVDVPEGSYYYDAVLWAVEQGITNGVDDTHFGPKEACTRAQTVTFLWRAAGEPAPASVNNPFIDVEQRYYTDAVLWAVYEGITTGTTDTTFEPNVNCTRAQVVTFLQRWKN